LKNNFNFTKKNCLERISFGTIFLLKNTLIYLKSFLLTLIYLKSIIEKILKNREKWRQNGIFLALCKKFSGRKGYFGGLRIFNSKKNFFCKNYLFEKISVL